MVYVPGTNGNDVLEGTAGDDVIDGFDGNDTIRSYISIGSTDVIDGGDGFDLAYFDDFANGLNSQVHIYVDANGVGTVWDRTETSLLATFQNLEQIQMTNDGGDYFENNSSIPIKVQGLNGSDTLIGGSGNDVLFGGYGSDTLLGREGDDILQGHDGDYVLDGGEGDDSYYSIRGKFLSSPGNDHFHKTGQEARLVFENDPSAVLTRQ